MTNTRASSHVCGVVFIFFLNTMGPLKCLFQQSIICPLTLCLSASAKHALTSELPEKHHVTQLSCKRNQTFPIQTPLYMNVLFFGPFLLNSFESFLFLLPFIESKFFLTYCILITVSTPSTPLSTSLLDPLPFCISLEHKQVSKE